MRYHHCIDGQGGTRSAKRDRGILLSDESGVIGNLQDRASRQLSVAAGVAGVVSSRGEGPSDDFVQPLCRRGVRARPLSSDR